MWWGLRRADGLVAMASPSVLVLDDARHVGLLAAELIANRIRSRPPLRVLLPTGHTPRRLYAPLRDHARDSSLPGERVTVLGLDGYGRAPSNPE
jgi:glucosamine-6-phosphate deaminase